MNDRKQRRPLIRQQVFAIINEERFLRNMPFIQLELSRIKGIAWPKLTKRLSSEVKLRTYQNDLRIIKRLLVEKPVWRTFRIQ